MKTLLAVILTVVNFSLEDIILDIYNAVTEIGETDYEQLQTDLYALHETPIDLNNTSEEELGQLYFLSPGQIDALLAYADRHPFEELYELRMVPGLEDYEIRDLLPFVRITKPVPEDHNNIMYAREVFAHARHEVITRVDARDIENYSGDPVYVQARYRFDYRRRVTFGAQLRRPAGGEAESLQYGAYLQIKDIGHLHTLVGGNFQASFGQGLVLAPVFHSGKSVYVQSAGRQTNGLRYYSSADGEGLHGAGATLRWYRGRQTRIDASALYSLKRANDSIWHHLAGANITLRHKQMEVQLTAIENIWSDSIHPYRDAAYNARYFRGRRQAVAGASVRYNHGWFDAFAEVATSQNGKWGAGLLAGSRFYPADGVSLVALYRYYSPWFDNALGYAFSESSRLGDENGGYVGFEVTRLRNWRFSGYGDVFYFSGPKYGVRAYPSIGYDALFDTQYIRHSWRIDMRLRARQKGDNALYSARLQFGWAQGGWTLRTTAEANMSGAPSVSGSVPYGVSIAQDAGYDFAQSGVSWRGGPLPLALHARLQFFDVREWANRIYLYEHDVLYAYSVPATYGLGGRAYVSLRWRILPQLAVYLRASETVYAPRWAAAHSRSATRTDVHLLIRLMF